MRPFRLIAAVLLAAPLVVVASSPASAVSGLTFVQAQSSLTGSQNFKNATATCPGDTRVYSTGYSVVDGLGKVSVNTLQPSSDLRTVFVEANETDTGINTNWRVFAQAVCGPPVSGLRRVPNAPGSRVDADQESVAPCGNNEQVYGGGFLFANGYGEVLLTRLTLTTGFSGSAGVRANVDDNTALSWGVTAYAICGANSPGLQPVFGQASAVNSTSPKSSSANCAAGAKIHGVGASLPQQGVDVTSDVVIEKLVFTAAISGVEAQARENDATTANWNVRAYATCGT
jgi:hypothetical protein